MSTPSKEAFLELCEGAPVEAFAAGDALFQQGEVGSFCYVILKGTVAVTSERAEGPSIRVATRGAGELIGELSLFQKTRSASVIADEPCECARISHAVLLQIVTSRPALALALLAATMDKVREYRDRP
jgi:CRP/FNR family transcriptional regulator, cyclic AMP receptor protein